MWTNQSIPALGLAESMQLADLAPGALARVVSVSADGCHAGRIGPAAGRTGLFARRGRAHRRAGTDGARRRLPCASVRAPLRCDFSRPPVSACVRSSRSPRELHGGSRQRSESPDRLGWKPQLRQDGTIQYSDRQPPEGRQLRRRHRRAQRRLAAHPVGPARAHPGSCRAPTASIR